MTPRRRRGAQAVEFALVLPVVLAIASATVDYGWYFHVASTATHAAGQGARIGAATAQDDDPVGAAQAAVLAEFEASGIAQAPTVEVTLVDAAPVQTIEVVTTWDFEGFVGWVPLPGKVEHTAVLRMEEQPVEDDD